MLELGSVRIKPPDDTNIIVGQAHFMETTEDMYDAVANAVLQVPSLRKRRTLLDYAAEKAS